MSEATFRSYLVTSLFHDLNPEQQEAIQSTEGRLLILAGAGSGKTRVLTTRMAYLVQEKQVAPKNILGLTFTNKAAQEMRHRVASLLSKKQADQITLCTFHSFCMKILREEIHHLGFTKDFSLYDEKDLERLVKLIARDILEHEAALPSLSATIHAISKANQKIEAPEKNENALWHDRFVSEVHDRLSCSLRAYNAVDFDHLLKFTVELFQKHPDVLARYQEQFRYIMIDEYQDTNPVQFCLAELLSARYNNLCVVGDDDQAIYGWRGAEVENILSFDRAKVIKLEQNYRSCNTILKAANSVIANNKSRHPKSLWSQKGDGDLINVFVAPTEKEEAESVVARIAALKSQKNISWNEVAILYRSNALSRSLELALLKQRWKGPDGWVTGIPFEIFGGTEFYERREIKDLLAYLRAILNPRDSEALLRIVNLPRRGIGEVSLDRMTAISRTESIPLWEVFEQFASGNELSARAKVSLTNFIAILNEAKVKFQDGKAVDALKWLIDKIAFRKCIEEDVKSDKMRAFKWENVEELIKYLEEYEVLRHESFSLQDFVSSLTLNLNAENFSMKGSASEKVSLMTFHSAKGLEFEACFLVGLEDHLIPHEKSLKETGIEEERRLMYVALTRAKKWLTLSMTKQRSRMGKDAASRPSRFLFEVNPELLKKVEWHDVSVFDVTSEY